MKIFDTRFVPFLSVCFSSRCVEFRIFSVHVYLHNVSTTTEFSRYVDSAKRNFWYDNFIFTISLDRSEPFNTEELQHVSINQSLRNQIKYVFSSISSFIKMTDDINGSKFQDKL